MDGWMEVSLWNPVEFFSYFTVWNTVVHTLIISDKSNESGEEIGLFLMWCDYLSLKIILEFHSVRLQMTSKM